MFKLPSQSYIKMLTFIVISLGLIFAFSYFFYSNSSKSKASYPICESGKICGSNEQCGQGKCIFSDASGKIGRCNCVSVTPTKKLTPTAPTPTPTFSYSPTPSPTPTLSPTPIIPEYYIKTSEWFSASPNVASTIIFGCNIGDIAVGGGMDGYSGPINIWRTVRSGPTSGTDLNGWQTTVINESSSTYQFTVTAKCLKLVK